MLLSSVPSPKRLIVPQALPGVIIGAKRVDLVWVFVLFYKTMKIDFIFCLIESAQKLIVGSSFLV